MFALQSSCKRSFSSPFYSIFQQTDDNPPTYFLEGTLEQHYGRRDSEDDDDVGDNSYEARNADEHFDGQPPHHSLSSGGVGGGSVGRAGGGVRGGSGGKGEEQERGPAGGSRQMLGSVGRTNIRRVSYAYDDDIMETISDNSSRSD